MKKNKKPILTLIFLYGIENRGVRYISSFLKEHGFSVNIIFFKQWVNNAIRPPSRREVKLLMDLLSDLESSLIGIGLGTPYLRIATQLTKEIKKRFKTPVIWGGIHPTISPEDGIDIADIICVGEGEEPLLDLMKTLERGKNLEEIPNLWIKVDGKIQKNPLRPLIEDLDRLPFPDYGGSDKYFIEDNRLKRCDPLLKDSEYRIYPSRGCPFNCKYCNNSILRKVYQGKGRYYRFRSPENVIAELAYARDYFKNLRRIKFDGDTFFFPEKWISRFSSLYKERIGIPF
ncbi:cobalamin-dependent protein, partial [bacterium]|nr:cobalamin-dependent protein [bacterium]